MIVSSGGLLVSTDGWPLTYPGWLSALDRRRIDDALSAATASATLPATPAIAPARVLTGPVHGRLFASETAAIEAVLQIFMVVVHVLSARRDGAPDDTRLRVADQLFDELVVWIADLTPSVTTVDTFADRVRDARETCSWWPAFARVQLGSSTVPEEPVTPTDERVPLSVREVAERLGTSNDTIERMIKKGRLKTVTVGERRKIPQSELDRMLNDPKWLR